MRAKITGQKDSILRLKHLLAAPEAEFIDKEITLADDKFGELLNKITDLGFHIQCWYHKEDTRFIFRIWL